MKDFQTSVLVDFPDDILGAYHLIGGKDIENLMDFWRQKGIKEIIWGYYADDRGGEKISNDIESQGIKLGKITENYKLLGNPIKIACQAAHKAGFKFYAYFKPYEKGFLTIPQGVPIEPCANLYRVGAKAAWVDPFIAEHPETRVARMDYQEDRCGPIKKIKIYNKDASAIDLEDFKIYFFASKNNYCYKPIMPKFSLHTTTEQCDHEVRDFWGNVITKKGDLRTVLVIDNLFLADNFLVLDFEILNRRFNFENAAIEMIELFDAEGRKIPHSIATRNSPYLNDKIDYKTWGLDFDCGLGKQVLNIAKPTRKCEWPLFENPTGFIGIARGINKYPIGLPCETDVAVQEHWLSCLDNMIKAGVDGVEFRIENHCMVDEPECYGWHSSIKEVLEKRGYQVNRSTISIVRGDAYTEFLSKAYQKLSNANVKMRIDLHVDLFRVDPPPERIFSIPLNVNFQWSEWIERGLMDEAVIRAYHRPIRENLLKDVLAEEMIQKCQKKGIDVFFNHHVFYDESWYVEEAQRIKNDSRFQGIILYENANLIHLDENRCWKPRLASLNNLLAGIMS